MINPEVPDITGTAYYVAVGGDDTLNGLTPAKNACDNTIWQGVPNITDYDGIPITDGDGNIVVDGGTVSCGAFQ